MVLPGTELWQKADLLQLRFDPEPPYFALSHFSMSAGDFEYGRHVIDACSRLWRSRAIRVLARERGVTFADLVDEWIAWQSLNGSHDPDGETMKRFIGHVCEQHGIPPDFYRRFAALEFA